MRPLLCIGDTGLSCIEARCADAGRDVVACQSRCWGVDAATEPVYVSFSCNKGHSFDGKPPSDPADASRHRHLPEPCVPVWDVWSDCSATCDEGELCPHELESNGFLKVETRACYLSACCPALVLGAGLSVVAEESTEGNGPRDSRLLSCAFPVGSSDELVYCVNVCVSIDECSGAADVCNAHAACVKLCGFQDPDGEPCEDETGATCCFLWFRCDREARPTRTASTRRPARTPSGLCGSSSFDTNGVNSGRSQGQNFPTELSCASATTPSASVLAFRPFHRPLVHRLPCRWPRLRHGLPLFLCYQDRDGIWHEDAAGLWLEGDYDHADYLATTRAGSGSGSGAGYFYELSAWWERQSNDSTACAVRAVLLLLLAAIVCRRLVAPLAGTSHSPPYRP